MYVVIVGAGEVGSHVARFLVEEGHDVAIVEADEDLARRLDASLAALVVNGSGVSPDVLRRAGIEQADLLLALTAVDEVNLIACMTGRKYGNERLRAVARVRESREVAGDLALSAEDLGLDALVTPARALVASALETLRHVGSGGVRELANGRLMLVEMTLSADSPLVHETLAEVRQDFPGEFLIVAVQGRDGIRIPTGGDRIAADEQAFVLTLPDRLMELAILSGQPWHRVKRVLVVGCGNTGLALARELQKQGLPLVIVERDRDRAELVAGLLPRSLVLHGDGSDPAILRSCIEEQGVDAAVVLLRDAEKSMLIGALAKSLGVRKVIVRCDKAGYIPLAPTLGVDVALSPRRAMADSLLKYVYHGAVHSGLVLGEHEAEVLELTVPQRPAHADLVTKPLKDIDFPNGSLVAAVIRGDQVLIGSGDTALQPGDQLLVVCRTDALRQLEKLVS